MAIEVVWFKRDLRLDDHAMLSAAALRGPVLPLIIVEPEYWKLPDTSARQWRFWRSSIEDLQSDIAARGGALVVRVGEATEVLSKLYAEIGSFKLWAHEETGNYWTYERDKAVHRWCKANDIAFEERRQFGVIRGPKVNRDKWAIRWDRTMDTPILPVPSLLIWERARCDALPSPQDLGLDDDGLIALPKAGREAALDTLNSFLHLRGELYTRAVPRQHLWHRFGASLDEMDGNLMYGAAGYPLKILHCIDDEEVAIEQSRRYLALGEHVELNEFSGLGHRRFLYHADAMAALVRAI